MLTGNQKNLKVGPKRKNEFHLPEAEALAEDCWLNKATIVEPNKHVRPHCAPVDESGETIPRRLQILTTDEAYNKFEEYYTIRVKEAMKRKCDQIRAKHTSKSSYNAKVNERLNRMENMFPSKSWFVSRKPCQTTMNQDHTTGLCKDCYSAQVNYDTLLKYVRRNCYCKTEDCPNWICLCSEDVCQCDTVCRCDDCESCQVRIKIYNIQKS